jgi:undecaprenyl-diphosphatase
LSESALGVSLEAHDSIWKTFAVFIQIGAILAVVVYFRRRILDLLLGKRALPHGQAAAGVPLDPLEPEATLTTAQRLHVLWMIALGTLPALVIGYLTHDWIEANLGSPLIIVSALFFGGLAMLVIEWFCPMGSTLTIEHINWKQALGIGFAQVLAALFPGTSRSASTIMGGMLAGLSREAAAEFSFFLAIPIMFAACGFSLLKYLLEHPAVTGRELLLFVVGTLVSFLVAWAVIGWFMNYIRRRTFTPFAFYRIALAAVVFFYAT